MATCQGALIVHAAGIVMGCTEDEDPGDCWWVGVDADALQLLRCCAGQQVEAICSSAPHSLSVTLRCHLALM
jgi:hypothetical protein